MRRFDTLLLGVPLLLLPTLAHASLPVLRVVRGPDFDGDGHADLGVSARASGTPNMNEVHLLWGSDAGLDAPPQLTTVIMNADLPGDPSDPAASPFVLGWGDFDGDCIDDLVIGEPCDEAGNQLESCTGVVTVLYGGPQGPSVANMVQLRGNDVDFKPSQTEAFGDVFGDAIAVGDFDGDLIDDLAVGAPGVLKDPRYPGAVAIFYGTPSGLDPAHEHQVLSAGPPGGAPGTVSWFGRSLAAGDFDCDGADDLAINAFGHVEVVYGADKGLDPATSQLFFADELGVGPGLGALAAGNFDSNVASRGDAFGFPACMDLAVGSSDAIAVVYGMPSDAVDPGLQLTTKPPTAFFGSDGFGRDLSIGRFDGGKYHDLAVAYQGGAFVLAGSSTGLVDIGSVDVPLVSATLGTMPSTVGYGDFAGDGMGDLVVGHAYDAPAGCVAGKCGSFDVADFVPAVSFKVDSVTSWTADDLPDASIADTTRLASRVTQGRAMFEPACFSFDPTDIEF